MASPVPLRADDLPTLRLVTLRRLLQGAVPPIVLDQATPISEVEAALERAPGAIAIFIDGARVLRGTLRLAQLRDLDRAAPAERVMSRGLPVIEGENDIEAARSAMTASAADLVVVVSPAGELLGILTNGDLARSSGSRTP